MSLQLWVKSILAQGDSISMAAFSSLQDQGSYALASNYGSLAARVLFQPIEESSRNLVSRLGTDKQNNIETMRQILFDILKLYLLFSLMVIAIGPPMAPLFLQLVAGSRWTNAGAGDVLACYCYYIPLLAINGITEAFVSAVASTQQLHVQSVFMFSFSVAFAGSAYVSLQLFETGAVGLVWASAISMTLRILWSTRFIYRYFQGYAKTIPVANALPHPLSIASAAIAAGVLLQLDPQKKQMLNAIVQGGGIALTLLASM
jgi:oligosaccharide translocation protein RFT1